MSESYFSVVFLGHTKSLSGALHRRGPFQTTVVATPQSSSDQTHISSTWKHEKYYGFCPMMVAELDGSEDPDFLENLKRSNIT